MTNLYDAMRQAATHIGRLYPDEQLRIGRGLTIALNDGVQLGMYAHDPDAWVRSGSDAEVLYEVRGTACDCPDQAAPGQRCKHRWAIALTRMAQALYDLRDHEEL